jgi:Predicted transcriptional regulator containing an HTH domain and an uncharacterized domain shared with the mammalian protein Schlafen
MERESRYLEYKESVTRSFLKTISAYANYSGGKVIFGVTDNYKIVGIEHLKESCEQIETMINDNINPAPDYSMQVNSDNTICVTVNEGLYKPYLYKNKAYKRNDSETIEVDRFEFNRLVMEGLNQTFEKQDTKIKNLSFHTLEEELISKLNIHDLNNDILKTLDLMTSDGHYNKAAELLADHNDMPGIEMVKFGTDINVIKEHLSLKGISILTQFSHSMDQYRRYYQYEKIEGVNRETVSLIPENAFREAVANALIHREWDIAEDIRVLMFDDHIEIISPGGLPNGISTQEYLNGQISLLRNPIIGNVFFRLNYIEKFGTGIRRINAAYQYSLLKPEYSIYENSIKVLLPVIDNNLLNLNDDQKEIIRILGNSRVLSRKQISEESGFNRDKTIRTLNELIRKNIVKKAGSTKAAKYSIL